MEIRHTQKEIWRFYDGTIEIIHTVYENIVLKYVYARMNVCNFKSHEQKSKFNALAAPSRVPI